MARLSRGKTARPPAGLDLARKTAARLDPPPISQWPRATWPHDKSPTEKPSGRVHPCAVELEEECYGPQREEQEEDNEQSV